MKGMKNHGYSHSAVFFSGCKGRKHYESGGKPAHRTALAFQADNGTGERTRQKAADKGKAEGHSYGRGGAAAQKSGRYRGSGGKNRARDSFRLQGHIGRNYYWRQHPENAFAGSFFNAEKISRCTVSVLQRRRDWRDRTPRSRKSGLCHTYPAYRWW